MKRTVEQIRKEMVKRGAKPSNGHDLIYWGILFAVEEIAEENKKINKKVLKNLSLKK